MAIRLAEGRGRLQARPAGTHGFVALAVLASYVVTGPARIPSGDRKSWLAWCAVRPRKVPGISRLELAPTGGWSVLRGFPIPARLPQTPGLLWEPWIGRRGCLG